jgi:acetolactate decarboxylase
MGRHFRTLLLIGLVLQACSSPKEPVLFQDSTIDAILAGVYDGDMSCGDLLQHGDFGIGTFDGLNGEMAVIDGTVYQVRADGKVYRPGGSEKLPFASVCRFQSDGEFDLPAGAGFDSVQAFIDRQDPDQNSFLAIRIDGTFRMMHTRSVPKQEKPYPPLAQVTAHQPEFRMQDVSGTIVGFRMPPFIKGINMPGYHLHFISSDRTQGGHILGFEIASGQCKLMQIRNFHLRLPGAGSGFSGTDLQSDRSHQYQQVEGAH